MIGASRLFVDWLVLGGPPGTGMVLWQPSATHEAQPQHGGVGAIKSKRKRAQAFRALPEFQPDLAVLDEDEAVILAVIQLVLETA
jgi:hypothetical protein